MLLIYYCFILLIANICWIMERAREFQKKIYFCFIDYAKAFDCVDHNKLWKILQDMGIPAHLTCLLRNLYVGQEATVRTGHGTIDWFQIGKGVLQGCILLPCLFNFYAEYIMRNAGLEEAQAGIKIAGRNMNNPRYADDTTLMAESEKELKSLLMKVKVESEKVGLKLNIQKTKIMAAAAAAKSLQLYPTLCDPIDGSPPGSPIPGILQARTLEGVAIFFSNAWKWKWSHSLVSDPQRPHGLQPSKLFCPWDLPGKSTGVGCHCLLQDHGIQSHHFMGNRWGNSVKLYFWGAPKSLQIVIAAMKWKDAYSLEGKLWPT